MLGWGLWVLATLAIPLTPCGSDRHEPNDERRKARLLASPMEGATCEGDPDWFKLHLEKGRQIEIVIDHHPTARLAAPQVYKPGGRKPVGRVAREKGRTRVRFTTHRTGNHRIRIAGADGTRTVYSLSVSSR